MQNPDTRKRLWPRIWGQIRALFIFSDRKRPWGYLVVAALSVGLPVFVGAWLGHFSTAVIASMGGLVILYMQQIPTPQRMTTLAVCSFGFAVSFCLGVLTSFNLYLSVSTLALTVFLVTLVCRYFLVPAPGSFFFILVACMSRTLPFDLSLAAERTGILLFGCMGACLLALIYGMLQNLPADERPAKQTPVTEPRVAAITLESAVIALFVGGGYLIALLIELDNPYWVPISTVAIMQGATFRAVWHRNVHRIFGTIIGMGLVWAIFSFSPNVWQLAGLIMLLSFLVEILITRNYGLAVIFITPLTVIFAESALLVGDTERLVMARLVDIIIGSVIGYIGGWVIHQTTLFQRMEQWMVRR